MKSRRYIAAIWGTSSLVVMAVAACLMAYFFNDGLTLSPVHLLISLALSVFHPGGWMLFGGLIWALRKRSLSPLILSMIGAVIIGAVGAWLYGLSNMQLY